MAEGGGLLNRYTVISRIVGSNPIPSANSARNIQRVQPLRTALSGRSHKCSLTGAGLGLPYLAPCKGNKEDSELGRENSAAPRVLPHEGVGERVTAKSSQASGSDGRWQRSVVRAPALAAGYRAASRARPDLGPWPVTPRFPTP